jgi:hypothetical protein|tara:strand:+ start:1553 stop:1768 length:216 start_codon:yes stop_codon:yes gene_type:complete
MIDKQPQIMNNATSYIEYLFTTMGNTTKSVKEQIIDALTANDLMFLNSYTSVEIWGKAQTILENKLKKLSI